MDFGCIAVIDALGFKGIWQRHAVEQVLDSMRTVREAVGVTAVASTKMFQRFVGHGGITQSALTTARFLSDTIVIAIHAPRGAFDGPHSLVRDLFPILMARQTIFAASFCVAAAAHPEQGVPLNYRGAIAWGDFLIEENVLIGPAVDEAAALHARSDGPFIEIAASAAEKVLTVPDGDPPLPKYLDPKRLMLEFDLPLKPLPTTERAWVMNPFAMCSTLEEVAAVASGVEAAFGDVGRREHPRKYLQAVALLAKARETWTPIAPARKA